MDDVRPSAKAIGKLSVPRIERHSWLCGRRVRAVQKPSRFLSLRACVRRLANPSLQFAYESVFISEQPTLSQVRYQVSGDRDQISMRALRARKFFSPSPARGRRVCPSPLSHLREKGPGERESGKQERETVFCLLSSVFCLLFPDTRPEEIIARGRSMDFSIIDDRYPQ